MDNIATATVGSRVPRDRGPAPQSEELLWDGLALIQRGDEHFINEPHVGNAPQKLCFGGEPRAKRSARRARKGPRGNPVASSKGTSYFNDALGTTVGAKKDGKYSAAVLTAFGENYLTTQPPNHQTFFTGKPYVEGLGHAFLMRNYRAGLAKWQTADPMGYPDGWNQLAYCNNWVTGAVDLLGAGLFNLIESAVQTKANGYINKYLNSETVNNLIARFSSTDADDLKITGTIVASIHNINITYKKTGAGPSTTTLVDRDSTITLDAKLERAQPEVYNKPNSSGDHDGPSIVFSDGDYAHVELHGLTLSDSVLGYTVTVTDICFDLKSSVNVKSRFLNFIKE